MIGEGLFQTQLNTINDILAELKVLDERQGFPNKGLGAADFKGLDYRGVYEKCIREYAYDFRLFDQSLLLFTKIGNDVNDGELGYSFMECPVKVMAYREFVGGQMGLTVMDEGFDEAVAEWGDVLRSDYEQYVTSLNLKSVVTPMRYDYNATQYKAGRHPASHVHLGFENQIRVGTQRVMKPLSFVLFVLRQRYPDEWMQFLQNHANMLPLCRNVREDLDPVDAAFSDALDQHELVLH